MKNSLISLAATLSLAFASCGGGSKGIYPVSGKVIYRGQPAVGAAVFFHPHAGTGVNDPLIMGIVGQDGRYELVCGSLGKGAPPGNYDVTVQWKRLSDHRNGSWRTAPDRLGGRYADPKHPLLHAEIKASANDLPPFKLTAASGE